MMNRTWKSVLSVLLALALLLPVAPAVRAVEGDGKAAEADEAVVTAEATAIYATESDAATTTSLSLTASKGTVYYRNQSHPGEITVTATGLPEGYSGKINWKLEDANDGLLSLESTQTEAANGAAQAKVKATRDPGANGKTVKLTASTDSAEGVSAQGSIDIPVKSDKIEFSTIKFAQSELSVQAGGYVDVKLTPEPVYPSGDKADVVYNVQESSAPGVVTLDPSSGRVRGEKAGGRAVITATIDGTLLEHANSKVIISVLTPSAEYTGTATRGVNFPMQPIYTEIFSAFNKSYSTQPTKISFPVLNSVNGTLYVSAAEEAKGSTSSASNPYNFSQLSTMFLVPTGEGDFKCEAEVTDDSGNILRATIKITVSLPSHTIYIPIDGSANYSFSRASGDVSGKTGAQLIREKIGQFGSLQFDAVPSASSSVGSLYTASKPSNDNLVSPYGGTVVSYSSIDELYFTPTRQGNYTVTFTAWSGSGATGNRLCKGTLILPVDSNSLDVSITLESVAPYTFSSSPGSGTSSLYSQMISTINNAVGASSWSGIRFDGAASASSTGTLRQSASHSYAISASTYIEKASISMLYFVPERTGTYTITYGVYPSASASSPVVTGTLTIKTSTIPAGAANISYPTSVKGSVTLSEDDFINFFQRECGSKYQLSFVVFNEYDGGGTFYHGATSFLPYNSADYYTTTYTGSVPANARYLKNLSFTAPSAAGYTAVLFTCYGGMTADSATTSVQGKLCIYYTANDVPAVTYNAFGVASVDLKADDFVTAYNAAMKSSVSKPAFTIQLLNVPSSGTLYNYYSGNNRTAITSSNIRNYSFAVNDKSGISVEQLTYIPNRGGNGTDTVTYLVTSTSGTVLYVGAIQFKLSSDLTLSVTNDGGANFRLSDFYSASDSDPVLYVTFPQPSAGKVYVYIGSRYVAVSADTKLYTVSSSDGQYPLTSAFYAPRANQTAGTLSLRCIAHRKSGVTNDNLITVNVLNKVSSGTFGDVGGVFSWAASSIDFANKMGLVNGTQVNPPLFSPSNTMRRSDFVLMLYRHAGSPAVSGSTTYADVPAGKYYYNSAVWAERNNIMRNVTVNGLYNPEGALTRQDFAQILFNFATYMGESTANNGSLRSYSDASSVSLNTLEGVTWAVAKGYIESARVGAMYIEPTREATRAEISTLLHRYLTY